MELNGEQILALPRERVWAALNDPDTLKQCVPGCDVFERVEENQYKVVMTAAVGPVKAKFTGKLTLSDLVPPQSYALTFEGSGGAAGFGKGDARVTLDEPQDGGTRLHYAVNAKVGGRLAQVGARLIDGVAKKMADEFFTRFSKVLAAESQAGQDGAASPTAGSADAGPATAVPSGAGAGASRASAAAPAPAAPMPQAQGGYKHWVWAVVGLVVGIIIGYYIKS